LWDDVRPRIVQALESLVDVDVRLYPPEGAPAPEVQRVGTKKPNLTPLRASLVRLIGDYAAPGYRLGLLEVQKLAYFWDRALAPTDLAFGKNQFGPYSERLNFVLQSLEGHFTRGYGDRSGNATITPIAGALDEVAAVLQANSDASARVKRVANLIEGFESPYGMELLSTVHWVATHDQKARHDVLECIARVHEWNDRKRRVLRSEHIEAAWQRLRERGWLDDEAFASRQFATPMPVEA
jgi:hypothetical protein